MTIVFSLVTDVILICLFITLYYCTHFCPCFFVCLIQGLSGIQFFPFYSNVRHFATHEACCIHVKTLPSPGFGPLYKLTVNYSTVFLFVIHVWPKIITRYTPFRVVIMSPLKIRSFWEKAGQVTSCVVSKRLVYLFSNSAPCKRRSSYRFFWNLHLAWLCILEELKKNINTDWPKPSTTHRDTMFGFKGNFVGS